MQQSENKMGVQPIPKLLLAMGLPMILSMVVQALYNIIDSYFVSQIPEVADDAMNALTLAFPIQMLIIAIGVGTGIGINALLSQYLGQGRRELAAKTAGNAVFLGLCTYVVFLLFGLFGTKYYLLSQTSNPAVLQMGQTYLGICVCLSFGSVLGMIYEKLLQSTGKTVHATIAQLIGALTNIVLDPILIFGMFGMPEMGVAGAAWATVIGQVVCMVVGMVFHYGFNKEIRSKLSHLIPQRKIIARIYQVGVPAIIMQALMSFMTYGVNIILGGASENYVTAYGIYYKIQQFAFFAAFGLNNAIIPLVAFNYGKGEGKRVKQTVGWGVLDTAVILLLCMAVLELFAPQIAGVFALSNQTISICIFAMRIIAFGYLFAGVNIAFQGIFQALSHGGYALLVSLIRLTIVALPLLWVLVRQYGANPLVFAAFPIAEICATVMALVLYWRLDRQLKREFAADREGK